MSSTITLSCPVYIDADDDTCGKPIEIDAWRREPQTYLYPGAPPGFEVAEAQCGHKTIIEDRYYDDIMQQLGAREIDALERAAERRYGNV